MYLKKMSYISIGVIILTSISPAFAEVMSFELDNTFYIKGDQIKFSGTVDEESKGLVTIVVRDSNNEFVLLTQAFIQSNNTFERNLNTNERFEDHGIHNATAFVKDLAEGKTVSFDFSQDGTLPIPSITSATNMRAANDIKDEIDSILQTYFEDIEEESKIADFVDPEKDPQYYLNRYYNEPEYKSWFDRNYPELTIEEAVGVPNTNSMTQTIEKDLENVITKDVLPGAQAIPPESNIVNHNNIEDNETAFLGLALGGLAILFGAVYGIKRKVDANSENITQNRESIRKRVFGTILNNNPEDIIKSRLAHGEITVDEFNNLKKALRKK